MVSSRVMTMLLTGAVASRQESSAMMQTSEVHAHLQQTASAGRDNQIAGMKEQILAFADVGVPDTAIPLLNSIKSTLSTGVLEAIKNETDVAKKNDADFRTAYTNASSVFDAAWLPLEAGPEGTKYNAVTNSKTAHSECRQKPNDGEHAVWSRHQTCLGQLTTSLSTYNTAKHAVTNSFSSVTSVGGDGACVDGIDWRTTADLETMSSALTAYAEDIDELKRDRSLLDAKLAECGANEDKTDAAVRTATSTSKLLDDKTAACVSKQDTYEDDSCTLYCGQEAANSQYTTAYDAASDAFTGAMNGIKEESANRYHQCQLVHTLMCYIEALVDHDKKSDLQTAVGACDDVAARYDAEDASLRAYDDECKQYTIAQAAGADWETEPSRKTLGDVRAHCSDSDDDLAFYGVTATTYADGGAPLAACQTCTC